MRLTAIALTLREVKLWLRSANEHARLRRVRVSTETKWFIMIGMPVSSIATHPQRDKIIAALVAKQPYRDITAWTVPPVGRGSLSRFKQASMRGMGGQPAGRAEPAAGTASIYDTGNAEVLPQDVSRRAMTTHASPFRSRLEAIWSTTARAIQRAETAVRVTYDHEAGELVASGADVSAVAPLIAQAHRSIELLGRATGELDAGTQSNTQVNILFNSPR